MTTSNTDKVTEAKTDKYPERPLKDALAKEKDIVAAENRPAKDQIEDYHRKHPTLNLSKAVEEAVDQGQNG